jgi:ABC-type sugar transport system substrate-binding protein
LEEKKMKIKRIFAVVLALAMLFAIVSCGTKTETPAADGASPAGGSEAVTLSGKDINNEQIKIAFIPISTAGLAVTLCEQAAEFVKGNFPNLEITFFDAQYDATTQISLVNQCVTQNFDAIVMEVSDSIAVGPAITDAEKAGIPVISMNMGTDTLHTMHIGHNSHNSGWLGGQKIAEALGNNGKAVLLDVPQELKASSFFGTGFEDYIAENTDIEIIDSQFVPGFSQEEANTIMRDLLTKHDDIDAVYCAGDDAAAGAIQAIEAAGRSGDGILVWGSCGYPSALEAIESGKLYGTCWEDVYGLSKMALNFALYFISSGINAQTAGYTSTPDIQSAFTPVTKDNVAAIKPQTHWPEYS